MREQKWEDKEEKEQNRDGKDLGLTSVDERQGEVREQHQGMLAGERRRGRGREGLRVALDNPNHIPEPKGTRGLTLPKSL